MQGPIKAEISIYVTCYLNEWLHLFSILFLVHLKALACYLLIHMYIFISNFGTFSPPQIVNPSTQL